MDSNQLNVAVDARERTIGDMAPLEGFRISCMLAGFKLGRISGPGIEDFLEKAGIRKEEWEVFLRYIGVPYMLSENERERVNEYFSRSGPVLHKLVHHIHREVMYYGMSLSIPSGHKYVWVDLNKNIYSSDQRLQRNDTGYIMYNSIRGTEGDLQSIEYIGQIDSKWDWFAFNQQYFSLSDSTGTPVSEGVEDAE